ncbi:hypothetical protein SFA35_07135 [Pseudomonas sp. HR96]|uniref:hypothetical protein n=1 Tax=Pseudomonas sp. HR96 TaxID=1027966 RepID=UPI002A76425F|nr:hypothetical protein [Pseudomonas sp. HR96]WPP01126.1 hypothetical protein SFA35_07135 [Pseudomonas sp. HR96]
MKTAIQRPLTSISLLSLWLWLLFTGLLSGPMLARALDLRGAWPDYQAIMDNLDHPAALWRWIVGDLSEVMFYKHEFASLGLLGGAALACWATRHGRPWQGFALARGSGLWPWVAASGLLGVLLGNLLWSWALTPAHWQPTFVAFASLPAAAVLRYGPGWRVACCGAIGAAVLVTPLSMLAVHLVCAPLQWPRLVGQAAGMLGGCLLAMQLFRRYPGLTQTPPLSDSPRPAPGLAPVQDYRWVLRRALADFSEAPAFGNEWASAGLILGVLLAWWLNPLAPVYGSGLLLELLGAQALAALLGVLRWRREWACQGWYPTYVPLVSVVPSAILLLGGALWVMIASALLGALITPPLAARLRCRLPASAPGCVADLLAMILGVLLILPPLALLASWQ